MYDRMQTLTEEQMTRIHDAAMDLLGATGIAFNEDEALAIFKKNGFKVDGKIVFFTEAQVRNALKTAPSRFTVTARNPEKSVAVGEDDFVFVPGYGAPFVTLTDGEQREATMADYDNFCKLVQTSKHINMNGFMMVEPSDVPADTAHLDMIFSSIVLSDKPFMGSPVSKQGARDCVDMAAIVWGGMDKLKAVGPVTVSLINSLSPLQFSDEMGRISYRAGPGQSGLRHCVADHGGLLRAGHPRRRPGPPDRRDPGRRHPGPAGQPRRPGGLRFDLLGHGHEDRRGSPSAAPSFPSWSRPRPRWPGSTNLPSRSGGGLTDAHFPDAQAATESTLALTTAARNGINFILHAVGILGSYISMSYEKFLIDEEVCGITRKLLKPMEITPEAIDVEMIKTVGIGGQYLTQPKTFKLCRTEFYLTDFMNRQNHTGWKVAGKRRIDEFAVDRLGQRLAAYEKPDIDSAVEAALADFVTRRKKG